MFQFGVIIIMDQKGNYVSHKYFNNYSFHIYVNRRCYHISVPTIKKDYVKTFNFIFYSCTLIVMPLMVFALIRLKKRVLKIEQDRKRMERESYREKKREREYGNHVLLKYSDDSHYSALAKPVVILLLQDVLFDVFSFSLNLSFPA